VDCLFHGYPRRCELRVRHQGEASNNVCLPCPSPLILVSWCAHWHGGLDRRSCLGIKANHFLVSRWFVAVSLRFGLAGAANMSLNAAVPVALRRPMDDLN